MTLIRERGEAAGEVVMTSIKPLSEVTTFISRGISPKYDESGYVVINQRCIRGQRVDFSNTRFSNREKTSVMPEKFVRQWDGLVNSTGVGTLGRVAQIIRPANSTIVDSHVTIVRPDLEQLDGRYFGYALYNVEKYIETLGVGATGQTELARGRLSDVEIAVPLFSTQRKISAILSAYDDLIENNLRRIKILEEMAQNLYREWFVKFRFPGHQNARFVDSPRGKIPEGWEVSSLAQTCHLTMGQSPKSEFYNKNGIGIPFHQGVTDFGDRFPTERLYCSVEARIAEKGDILFSVRAPVGRINIANVRMVIGRGLSAIRNKTGFQWFTFHHLKETFKEEDMMGGGTIFKSVTKNDMENITFFMSKNAILTQFEYLVDPLERHIENLMRKNSALRRTRDLLLPKLISGEVDVSELDIIVPEEAA